MRRFAPAFLLLTAAQASSDNRIDWRWSREGVACTLQQASPIDGKIVSVSRTPGNDLTSISSGGADDLLEPSKTYSGGKVLFLPGGPADAELYVTTKGRRRDVTAVSDDPDFLGKFASASEFEFAQEKLGTERLPLRSAAAAAQALRTCEDSRMREWGMDPVAWHALKARPLPTETWTNWLSTDDYPLGAIFAGKEGYLISRLDVGPDGIPTGCTSLNRNRPPNYKDMMCRKLVLRARFRPALDSGGKPVAAPFVVVVRFRLA